MKRILKTKDYTAMMMWLESHPHAAMAGELFQSSSGMHFFHCSQKAPATPWEARVDELFARFTTSPDAKVGAAALTELQYTWQENQPFIYLVSPKAQVVVRSHVEFEGMAASGRASHPLLGRGVIEKLRVKVK